MDDCILGKEDAQTVRLQDLPVCSRSSGRNDDITTFKALDVPTFSAGEVNEGGNGEFYVFKTALGKTCLYTCIDALSPHIGGYAGETDGIKGRLEIEITDVLMLAHVCCACVGTLIIYKQLPCPVKPHILRAGFKPCIGLSLRLMLALATFYR